jgi:hypothetical protein
MTLLGRSTSLQVSDAPRPKGCPEAVTEHTCVLFARNGSGEVWMRQREGPLQERES